MQKAALQEQGRELKGICSKGEANTRQKILTLTLHTCGENNIDITTTKLQHCNLDKLKR